MSDCCLGSGIRGNPFAVGTVLCAVTVRGPTFSLVQRRYGRLRMSNARAAASGRDHLVIRVLELASITMRNVTGPKRAVARARFLGRAVRSAVFWDPELMADRTMGAAIGSQLYAAPGSEPAHAAQSLRVPT